MERKSMGSFIAALRKANGYTQKDLAEKLNVSDKAVSRWERDESAPDLTLIPIIAEIFDVTADELLCGERKSVKSSADNDKPAPKAEKQLKRYFDTATAKLRNLTLIPIILSACTVLSAVLIPNKYVALAVGSMLAVIAIVSEIIFLYNAHTSIVSEDFDEEKLNAFKKKTVNFAKISFTISFYALYFLFVIDGFLIFTTAYYAEKYDQLRELFNSTHNIFSLDVLFIIFLYAVFAYILFNALWSIVMQRLIKRKVYPADNTLGKTIKKQKYFFITVCLIASVTLYCGLNGFGSNAIDDFCNQSIGKTFNDFDSFKKYIETPEEISENVLVKGLTLGNSPETVAVRYDELNYDSASEDEALLCFTDDNDNKLCEFYERNENVGQYLTSDNGYLPITVYTYTELAQKSLVYRSFWVCVLTAELIAAAVVYLIIFKLKRSNAFCNSSKQINSLT